MIKNNIQKATHQGEVLSPIRSPLHKIILPQSDFSSYPTLTREESFDKEYLIINLKNQLIKLLPKDVIVIKADGTYSMIYMENGQKIFTSKTLKFWQERLVNYDFWRCHASFLINPDYIVSYQKMEKAFHLTNNLVANVSRKYAKKVVSDFTCSSI